ncbi:MCP four helix bundle domain-containing protein [Pseudoduganella sp. UC29_106]|uniref:MCP four helix bundle domain-containing protein n=1 Tax=Pseudoduganella sp. UC29_106 TaxID=3374553 RepID=UPI00375826F1
MLSKLRIGPKLLLAPGVVLVLLLATTSSAWMGMVRQNASMENLVQVRAARLKAAADVAGEARFAHANIYQLLAWINGSFAKERLDALVAQIRARHAAIGSQLRGLAEVATAEEKPIVAASLAALSAYRRGVLETVDLAQVDQSIATNSMAKAEKQFEALDGQLARLAALEKTLSETAFAQARSDFHSLGVTMALFAVLSVVLSLLVSMRVRTALLRDIALIGGTVRSLAAGKLTAQAPSTGRDEIAETSRVLGQSIAHLKRHAAHDT